MPTLIVSTPLVYAPFDTPPRVAAVQVEPVDDPHFEVRAVRPGPPGRCWRLRVQVCRLQPGWGYFGLPRGHTYESLGINQRVVLAWYARESGWACPGVFALRAQEDWNIDEVRGWTAVRCFEDERAASLAYGLARLQVVSLVRRLRCVTTWRGVPDRGDLGDFTLDTSSLAWLGEGGRVHHGDLPGAWP